MKVLQIVADGSPGGGTTNVLALTEDLIDHDVTVAFCSQDGSYALDQAKNLGATVCPEVDFFKGRLDSRVVNQLATVVRDIAPEIIHVHGGRAAFPWVRGADPEQLERTIYTVRGYHFYRKSPPIRYLAKRAERRISRMVYKTVHVCQDDQDAALRHGFIASTADSLVIRNGIRVADIPVVEARSEDSEPDRKQIAVLGRLEYQKNPDLVLDLAKTLASEGFQFHLIGGGEMERSVRERIEQEQIGNAVVHGNQPRAEALAIMSRAGTFLLASRWEGLPIAPVEAMQMGLAVVLSDVNGNTEVVRADIEGRIAPSEDLQAFAAALRAVVAEPVKTAQMIQNGRQRVASEFTRDRVVQQHLELYESCVSQATR